MRDAGGKLTNGRQPCLADELIANAFQLLLDARRLVGLKLRQFGAQLAGALLPVFALGHVHRHAAAAMNVANSARQMTASAASALNDPVEP